MVETEASKQGGRRQAAAAHGEREVGREAVTSPGDGEPRGRHERGEHWEWRRDRTGTRVGRKEARRQTGSALPGVVGRSDSCLHVERSHEGF